MRAKDHLGRRGEQLAAEYLQGLGHEIIERNWRCEFGEIDVVSRDATEIIFTEVKTRRSLSRGHPLEAITPEKLARLRRLAGAWVAANPHHPRRIRIDALGIIARLDGRTEIHHRRAIGA